MLLSHALLAAHLFLGAVHAISPISVVGNKFFDSDGSQFFIKGVAYQLTEGDPLVDTQQCTRDAALMKQLGANTIRVYHVDPTANHDACMSVLADNGIYLFVDLDTFTTAIAPVDTTWTDTMYAAFAQVMDAFHAYDNTLGFFIGNEIIVAPSQSLAAPYIKAATRDLKAYRARQAYRAIPIGYAAADIAELRPMLQDYLVCGDEAADAIDFFGLNSYEWCGASTFAGSGYAHLNAIARAFPVPIFFSETGCATVKPRTFQDQAAILGPDMAGLWSGAIVYEWIEEANDYGLISYGPVPAATQAGPAIQGGFSRAGTPLPVTPDFANLQAAWATLSPLGTPLSAYSASQGLTTPQCPASTASGWLVPGNVALPARDATLGPSSATSASESTRASAPASSETAKSSSAPRASSGTRTLVPSATNGGTEALGMSIGLLVVSIGVIWWL